MPLYFGRTTCSNRNTESFMESNIYFDKRFNGQIYMNIAFENDQPKTFKSMNNGRFWYEMKFFNHDRSEYRQPVHFNFSLQDSRRFSQDLFEIDIQYQQLSDGLQPFITFDIGYSWIRTPKTRNQLTILDYTPFIFAMDLDTNFINFSWDEAKTWIKYKLFTKSPKVLYVGKFSKTDQKVIIVTREASRHEITFTILDFSKLFSFPVL
ncbi:hypothetical protein RF11_14199 [Thelohanellus kitauei]|uniref:Uncharacterized protein n=1 Tax=Thelohanellus kitauei TaxID=669202 RepID=A0A0C2MZH9_THEKT|nr:hypothetical protein RF11_14199 [Thelohanellus kitauei]